MTPFQILLIDLTIVLFMGLFSHATKKTNPSASNVFGIISGLSFLITPLLITWCITHYINI